MAETIDPHVYMPGTRVEVNGVKGQIVGTHWCHVMLEMPDGSYKPAFVPAAVVVPLPEEAQSVAIRLLPIATNGHEEEGKEVGRKETG